MGYHAGSDVRAVPRSPKDQARYDAHGEHAGTGPRLKVKPAHPRNGMPAVKPYVYGAPRSRHIVQPWQILEAIGQEGGV